MWKGSVVLVAAAGAGLAVYLSVAGLRAKPVPPLDRAPVANPYPDAIAGSGIVEPFSENVVVGVPDPGLVMKVLVKEGQKVKEGEALFQLDARALEAQLVTAKASVDAADAELARVKAYRRKEEEPGLKARQAETEAMLAAAQDSLKTLHANAEEAEYAMNDLETQQQRLEKTVQANASTREELDRVAFQLDMARARRNAALGRIKEAESQSVAAAARVEQAKADLAVFLAGAWPADVQKAQAGVEEAQAAVRKLELDIARRTVTAPLDASVLRVNLRQGEYALAGNSSPEGPGIVLGNIEPLHIRVDVDEFDAPRFDGAGEATAYLKGATDKPIRLAFVRVDPFVVPKQTLSGGVRELVDTRVLQVIYKVEKSDVALYVGQQVDVFIRSKAQ